VSNPSSVGGKSNNLDQVKLARNDDPPEKRFSRFACSAWWLESLRAPIYHPARCKSLASCNSIMVAAQCSLSRSSMRALNSKYVALLFFTLVGVRTAIQDSQAQKPDLLTSCSVPKGITSSTD